VERLADLLDKAAEDADAVADEVFADAGMSGRELRAAVRRVGRIGGLNAKCQESLASLARMVAFAVAAAEPHGLDKARLREFGRDLRELETYAGSLAARLEFLLDAALGLIAAEQNQSMRAMSIVAVLFLPPTLIASIYGMNFAHMPELARVWGYPLSLLLMVAAAVLLYVISKRNRWL
jgi:magnesium transporter